MLITKKMLVALTLVGALLGAGVGALVTHSASNSTAANTTATTADANPTANQTANQMAKTPDQIATENSTQFKTSKNRRLIDRVLTRGIRAVSVPRTTARRRRGRSLLIAHLFAGIPTGGFTTITVARRVVEPSGRSTAIN